MIANLAHFHFSPNECKKRINLLPIVFYSYKCAKISFSIQDRVEALAMKFGSDPKINGHFYGSKDENLKTQRSWAQRSRSKKHTRTLFGLKTSIQRRQMP